MGESVAQGAEGDSNNLPAGSKPAQQQGEPQLMMMRPSSRVQVIDIMSRMFGTLSSNFAQTMQNLPGNIAMRPITKDNVTVKSLPSILDSADTYFRQVLNHLARHEDAVPDAVDVQNIRHAFMTMKFVQEKLHDIADYHGEPKNGPGIRLTDVIDTPPSYVDKFDMQRGKYITALDIGAQADGEKGRSKQLSGVEKQRLRDVSTDIGFYCSTMAFLLGIKVHGFALLSTEGRNSHIEHPEIDQALQVHPPQAWKDGMAKFSINMPVQDVAKYTFGGRG